MSENNLKQTTKGSIESTSSIIGIEFFKKEISSSYDSLFAEYDNNYQINGDEFSIIKQYLSEIESDNYSLKMLYLISSPDIGEHIEEASIKDVSTFIKLYSKNITSCEGQYRVFNSDTQPKKPEHKTLFLIAEKNIPPYTISLFLDYVNLDNK